MLGKMYLQVLSLPWKTHLPQIVSDVNTDTQLHKRFLKFIKGVLGHENRIINMCCK